MTGDRAAVTEAESWKNKNKKKKSIGTSTLGEGERR